MKWKNLILSAAVLAAATSCGVRADQRTGIYSTMEKLIEYSKYDRYADAAPLIASYDGQTDASQIRFLDYNLDQDKRMVEFVCSLIKTLTLTHDRYEFGRVRYVSDRFADRYHLTVVFVKGREKKSADFSFVYHEGRVGLANFDINW